MGGFSSNTQLPFQNFDFNAFNFIALNFVLLYFYRGIPKRLKDKLVSYILVLALIIDNYSLEYSVILKDLGIAASRYVLH